MTQRLVSVGDDFTLPAAVKAADANLPARLQDTALNATYAPISGSTAYAAKSVETSKLDSSQKGSASGVATLDSGGKVPASQMPDLTGTYAPLTVSGAGVVRKGDLVFNVRDYGALGNWNGTTGNDDTAAIQSAINAAVAAGGGIVFFPAGNYRVQPQSARTSDPGNNAATDGHALLVNGSNVVLTGAGKSTTKLTFRAYGGGDPTTSYQTVSSKVWRGGGIFIVGGSTSGTTTRNIRIERLEMDGGCTYTGLNTYPASTSTGDGWDITNKGVWLQNDKYIDNVTIEDCILHNFRGEVVYSGGLYVGKVTGRKLEIYGTNGDCWSTSGAIIVEDCELYQAAGHGIEDAYFSANCYYRRNYVHDCALTGITSFTGSTGTPPFGNSIIEDNLVVKCATGIESYSPHNLTIRRNRLVDCGTAAGKRGVSIDTNGGYTANGGRNIAIYNNQFFASTMNVQRAIQFVDAAARGYTGVSVYDNRAELTAAGVANGVTFTQAYDFASMNDTKALMRNNTARGTTYEYTDQMVASDVLLTGTAATDVVKCRPEMRKNFTINVAYRVVTAATNVTINVTFYDGSGTQQTVNVVASASKAVGYYTVPATFVNAQGATESQYIKVTATAGTASQVYVSASISEVPTA